VALPADDEWSRTSMPTIFNEKSSALSKLVIVCLTVLLAPGIIFYGHAEAKALFDQKPTPITLNSPRSTSNSLYSNALDTNSFPTAPDIIILSVLFDRTQGAFWSCFTDFQRQIRSISRAGHNGVPACTNPGLTSNEHEKYKSAALAQLPESLYSLSPPGLILRL
jgi:hypothetical protein